MSTRGEQKHLLFFHQVADFCHIQSKHSLRSHVCAAAQLLLGAFKLRDDELKLARFDAES